MEKLNFLIRFFIIVGIMVVSGCKDDNMVVPLDDLSFNMESVQLEVNEIQPLTASPSPENSTQTISWESSDKQVAVIQFSDNGFVAGVKGVALGNVTLTATSTDGKTVKTIPVAVIKKVKSITLEEVPQISPSGTMYRVVFAPADASIQTVIWSSSNPSVATVVDGLITAVSSGITVITATSDQGGKTASVEIAVSGNPPIIGFQYCDVSGMGSYNADVVQTTGGAGNINNTEAQPSGNYHYYEEEKLIIAPGSSFDLSVTQSNNWSMTVVWIDWNGDKDFTDAGEQVQVFGIANQSNDGPFNATIDVPLDAKHGLTRMRVLTGDAWATDQEAAPCGEIEHATIKDFDVEVGKVYCSVSGTGSYNPDAVQTIGGSTNIDNNAAQPSGNYHYYEEEKVAIARGGSFDISVSQSNTWSLTVVWIDWNGDKDFEDSEELALVLGTANNESSSPLAGTITVPADAQQGFVRMRVMTGDAWTTDTAAEPCGEVSNSTTKDFNIEIL